LETVPVAFRTTQTPIIAMTARSLPGDRERCVAAGMDDYLAKPVWARALDIVIKRWLPGHAPDTRSGDASSTTIDAGDAPRQDDEGLNHATVAQLKEALTSEMRRTLVETFEESVSKCLADIAGAARRGDRVELRRVLHLLKGGSATVGATGLAMSCQRLEDLSRERDMTFGQEQLDELDIVATKTCPALREQLL
jgi:two-component system sensor histidine kinase/response regulator